MDSTIEQVMMPALLGYGVFAGVMIVEGMRAALALIGTATRLSQLRGTLTAFWAAEDDDERQRLMIRAGLGTLVLSLMLFATLSLACVVMSLPLTWATPTSAMLAAYMAVLGIASLLWWRLRRARR